MKFVSLSIGLMKYWKQKNSQFFFLFSQGYGTNFFSADEYYEGEWYADKRSGWGRMYYGDGSIYEGEWYNDQRSGQGMLRLGMLISRGVKLRESV